MSELFDKYDLLYLSYTVDMNRFQPYYRVFKSGWMGPVKHYAVIEKFDPSNPKKPRQVRIVAKEFAE